MTRLNPCDCGLHRLARAQRSLWMLPFANRRLYVCTSCSTLQFLPKGQVEAAQLRWQQEYFSAETQPAGLRKGP